MMIRMELVDEVLDILGEDDNPADDLALLIDGHGEEWMRSEDMDDKYAVIESSGAVWYVHVDINGNADCRRCSTWDKAYGHVPEGV